MFISTNGYTAKIAVDQSEPLYRGHRSRTCLSSPNLIVSGEAVKNRPEAIYTSSFAIHFQKTFIYFLFHQISYFPQWTLLDHVSSYLVFSYKFILQNYLNRQAESIRKNK